MQLVQKYKDVLREQDKELGYFAEQLNLTINSRDFFRILCECIIPLFRNNKRFQSMFLKFAAENDKLRQKYQQLQIKTYNEISISCTVLTMDMYAADLIDNEMFKENLNNLNRFFSTNAEITTSFMKYCEHSFEQLCEQLFLGGHDKIIEHHVELKTARKYRVDDESGRLIIGNQPNQFFLDEKTEISKCKFAPSLYDLIEIEEFYSPRNISTPWVAAMHIMNAEWYWSTPYSFFEDQKGFNQCETIDLMNHHVNWIAMDTIKNPRNRVDKTGIFTVERYAKYFELVFNELVIQQAIIDTHKMIYALKINFIGGKTILEVEKTKNDIKPIKYILKKSQDQGITKEFKIKRSNPYLIMEKISIASDNTTIDLSEFSFIDSRSQSGLKKSKPADSYTSYYMKKLKFPPVIRDIFFTNLTANTFTIRSKYVILSDLSEINFNQLNKYLSKLKELNDDLKE